MLKINIQKQKLIKKNQDNLTYVCEYTMEYIDMVKKFIKWRNITYLEYCDSKYKLRNVLKIIKIKATIIFLKTDFFHQKVSFFISYNR